MAISMAKSWFLYGGASPGPSQGGENKLAENLPSHIAN